MDRRRTIGSVIGRATSRTAESSSRTTGHVPLLIAGWNASKARSKPPPAMSGWSLAANLANHRLASRVRGALLVAPCDLETTEKLHPCVINFGLMPRARLPFPSLVVGSLNDPYMSVERLRLTARCWGSALIDLGDAGHINIASGFGRAGKPDTRYWTSSSKQASGRPSAGRQTAASFRRRPPAQAWRDPDLNMLGVRGLQCDQHRKVIVLAP